VFPATDPVRFRILLTQARDKTSFAASCSEDDSIAPNIATLFFSSSSGILSSDKLVGLTPERLKEKRHGCDRL
jgi:hypothetical protein